MGGDRAGLTPGKIVHGAPGRAAIAALADEPMVGRLIRASLFRGDVGVADDVKIAMSVGANSLRIRRYAAGVLESINVTPGGSAIETAADQPGPSAAALDSNVGIAHRKNARGGMG